jgi:hypothetical protein
MQRVGGLRIARDGEHDLGLKECVARDPERSQGPRIESGATGLGRPKQVGLTEV